MIEDELPNLVADNINTASEDVCHSLQPLSGDVVVYYTGVQANTTAIHNHAHHLRKIARDGAVLFSGEQLAVKTELIQDHMTEAIPLWKEKFRALSDSGGRMQDIIYPLRHSLNSLLMGLQEGLAVIEHAKNEIILQLPWQQKLTSLSKLSWLEPEETHSMTKAIMILDQWISETSALDDIFDETYSDMMAIHKMILDVYKERLGYSARSLCTNAELPEMLPFLGWIARMSRVFAAQQNTHES